MTRASKLMEVSREELEALIKRAQAGPLDEADGRKLQAVVETLCLVTQWLENKTTTIARLRQMIFGASTEKTRQVLKPADPEGPGPAAADASPSPATAPTAQGNPEVPSAKAKKGHGRNGAAAYTGATRIQVSHSILSAGGGLLL